MLKSYYSDEDQLMLHLLPHWNWSEGEEVRVCAMTNCDEVQLFVNGRPLEKKKVVRKRAEWLVPYEAGVIRAEATTGDVKLVDEVRTAGNADHIEVVDAAPEKDFDASIINVRLMDENDIPVPGQAPDREVCIEVHSGTLIGAGNGDPNGLQPDVTDVIPTFCGRCQFIVRPDSDGKVHVMVKAKGLPEVEYRR